jgi:hypothetical protein
MICGQGKASKYNDARWYDQHVVYACGCTLLLLDCFQKPPILKTYLVQRSPRHTNMQEGNQSTRCTAAFIIIVLLNMIIQMHGWEISCLHAGCQCNSSPCMMSMPTDLLLSFKRVFNAVINACFSMFLFSCFAHIYSRTQAGPSKSTAYVAYLPTAWCCP